MQWSQFKVFFKYIIISGLWVFFLHRCFCTIICMLGTYEDLKRAWNSLDLEL